ncbi:MAG: FmdE family protein [Candidatus Bipolaricaulota bacterium]
MRQAMFEDAVRFHGHRCPGLAIGYRMTVAGLEALEAARALDEELVAIVENEACGVDAVQFLAGCTFGKGNLVFHDYGKPVYTFYSRATGRGIRVLGHLRGLDAGLRDDREAKIRWILAAPQDEVVSCREVAIDEPAEARIRASAVCEACGEPVMETRLLEIDGRRLCTPCAQVQADRAHATGDTYFGP